MKVWTHYTKSWYKYAVFNGCVKTSILALKSHTLYSGCLSGCTKHNYFTTFYKWKKQSDKDRIYYRKKIFNSVKPVTSTWKHIFTIIIFLKASWVWRNLLPASEEVCTFTYSLWWYGNVSLMMRGYFKHRGEGGGGRNSWMAKPYCEDMSLVPNHLLLQKRKIHPC